jgi:altronate dehydratase
VIKICGNPRTVRTTKEQIDVDVTGLLRWPPPIGPPHK